jgi:ATP adenylyltransferase
MRYVGGGAKEEGCVFCNRLAAENDVEALVLHRSERAFAILNLFPYNTGHLMLVPNAHVASPEEAPAGALAELALLLRPTLRALRRALGCQGFNVGFNVGAVAGAGVAEHLHQHVVPRWTGDANFMPIIASTMVMPELIPVTYAKVRAELEREVAAEPVRVGPSRSDPHAGPPDWEDPPAGSSKRVDRDRQEAPEPDPVRAVVLTPDRARLLIADEKEGSRLPQAVAGPQEPIWKAAIRAVGDLAGGVDLAGWAGQKRAALGGPWALTLCTREPSPVLTAGGCGRWVETAAADAFLVDPFDRTAVQQATALLAPSVVGP